MPINFAFDLLIHQKKIFLKNNPLFGPFLAAGPFVTLGTSFEQT